MAEDTQIDDRPALPYREIDQTEAKLCDPDTVRKILSQLPNQDRLKIEGHIWFLTKEALGWDKR